MHCRGNLQLRTLIRLSLLHFPSFGTLIKNGFMFVRWSLHVPTSCYYGYEVVVAKRWCLGCCEVKVSNRWSKEVSPVASQHLCHIVL